MPRKMLFITPSGVHLLDIGGPAHVFHEARENGSDINLFFISINKGHTHTNSYNLPWVYNDSYSFYPQKDKRTKKYRIFNALN